MEAQERNCCDIVAVWTTELDMEQQTIQVNISAEPVTSPVPPMQLE